MNQKLLKTLAWVTVLGAGQVMAQTIGSVTPGQLTAGDPPVTLTITGTNFKADNGSYVGSRVTFTGPGGSSGPIAPTTVTPTSIVVTIPGTPALTQPGTGQIVVSNVGDESQSSPFLLNILPTPTITSLQLNPTPLGAVRALSVFGTNFIPSDIIFVGPNDCFTLSCLQPLNTTFNSPTYVSGSLPGSYIPLPGTYNVFVRTPGNGLSNSSLLLVGFRITSLTPSTTSQNVNPPPVLTVTAEGALIPGYQIVFNGTPLATVIDSPTQAHAQLSPANVATVGSFPVFLQNTSLGVTSNTLTFTVVPSTSAPTITTVTPNTATAGDPATFVTIQGANFQQDGSLLTYTGARVIFTPPGGAPVTLVPSANSGTILSVTIPQNLLATAGVATIAVSNVSDGKTSNSLPFTIVARPVITSLVQNPSPAGATVALLVFGSNFNPGDKILIGPPGCLLPNCLTALNTTFNSSNSLSGPIPGNIIGTPGNYNVFVQNALGALSLPFPLTIQLTLTSLMPNSAVLNSTPGVLTVQAVGGLASGAVIYFNGTPLATIVDSPIQAHATLLPANLSALGSFPVYIQQGSFTSTTLPFLVVTGAAPSITSINPNGAPLNGPNTPVTITGANFQQDQGSGYTGARVIFTPPGGNPVTLIPTTTNPTSLLVTIPSYLLTSPGLASVVVVNVTDNKTSNAVNFQIGPVATISQLTPNPTGAGLTTALVVQGSNFSPSDTVLIGAPGCTIQSCLQALNTTFNASNSLSASLPGSLIPNQGIYNIYVLNSFGALSAPSPLTVTLGISSLNPSSATQNAAPPTVAITSTGGFLPGATAFFAGQPVQTTYVSPTQVNAILTAGNVAVAGAYPIYVQNPNQQRSNSLLFTVNPQGQVISISPSTAIVGSGPITLQVTGANFSPTDVVRFGNSILVTTYNSAQSLTATIPAFLLTSAGNFTVTVLNSLNNSSNGMNFSVTLQITGLSPAFVTAGGPAFNITATLTGGVDSTSYLTYAGTQLATVSFTSTSITATVPANLITAASTPPVVAFTGSNQSNTVNHLVLGPVTLTSISPNFADAGSSGLTITLTGVGFDSGSFATVNGLQVPTVFVNSTTLTAQISTALLATAGTLQVGVTDSRNRTSNQVPFSVLTPLLISSLSPASISAGSPQFTLTVTGAGYDNSSVVKWNGQNLVTTFVNATTLTAIVPSTLVANVVTVPITVGDSRSRLSNAVNFNVVSNFFITSLNPSSALVSTAVNLTITGTGFPYSPTCSECNTVLVYFGNTSVQGNIVSPTLVTATIPSNVNNRPGVVQVYLVTSGQVISNSLPFNVTTVQVNPGPVITAISPDTVSTNAGGTVLTVDGSGFGPSSIVTANGASLPTTYVSGNRLTAILPSFTGGGVIAIQVVNPTGSPSNIVLLNVNGSNNNNNRPTLTSITPSSIAQGSASFTILGEGTGFVSGAVLTFGSTPLVTQVLSSTQVSAIVPASLVASSGQFPVFLTNPGGSSSGAVLFTVISGRPAITSLTPSTISAGAPQFTLTVNGTGFKSGATVSFGGVTVPTTFGSANQLTAVIPASSVKNPGTIPVIVTNPDGASSDPVNFTVTGFSLISISPASALAGGDTFTLTLSGTGFQSGAAATFNGTTLATTFVSSSTLTAVVPAALIATGGVVPVTVINADGAVAGPVSFTIRFGITLDSISPSTASAGSRSVAITAIGSGFVAGATIQFNGVSIPTTFGSATRLTGTIPADALTTVGSFPVTVSNPTGETSNALTFTVTPALPAPTITSISPTTAVAGSAAITLTVTGTNFVQGSTVMFGGTNAATTFVSDTTLRATISAAQLSQGGTFTVVVTNPDGNQSNAVTFIVTTPLSITSLSPAALTAGADSATLVITGSGIVAGATVQLGTTTITPDTTTPTQISLTVPKSVLATAGQLNVTVTNPDGTVSNALVLTIVGLPTISINATIVAASPNQVVLTLDQPAPVDLTGTLVMTFVGNALNTPANYVDPAQQFAAGGTSINFTIAKGSTTAVLPGNGIFSPGSVAGTLTFTLTRLLAGIDNVLSNPPPSRSFIIDRAVPNITANTVRIVNSTSGGFTVEVTGFVTSREITRVNLTFTTTPAVSIDGGGTVSVDVSSVFNAYFASTVGLANGGAFKLSLPFTISGADANTVTAVTVSLTNSVGTSGGVTGTR